MLDLVRDDQELRTLIQKATARSSVLDGDVVDGKPFPCMLHM